MITDRSGRILNYIVRQYITNAAPVPSQTVADKANLGVSPATIRNEMAYLEREGEKDVGQGGPLAGESPAFQRLQGAEDGQRCRAYGEDGSFVGILRYDGGARLWRPQKVFITARPNV